MGKQTAIMTSGSGLIRRIERCQQANDLPHFTEVVRRPWGKGQRSNKVQK